MEKEKIVLIDTNIIIDHLRNFEPATNFFNSISEHNLIIFSAITETELLSGQANNNKEKREELLQLLNQWYKIPIENPIALLAGDLSRKYNLEVPDSIIAATALLSKAILVTKNEKHFISVSNLILNKPY